jgi:hypothetical protein
MPGHAKKKKSPSSNMLQRMSALEAKLGKQLVARVVKHKMHSKLQNHASARKKKSSHGGTGRLGLGMAPSGATNRRSQVIDEDEYIGEINGSVLFTTTAYPMNPGQAATHPWGSRLASLYEEYDYEELEFYYKREVSEFATNGQTGKVILSIDYDAADAAPTSKQQVEDTQPHMDGMPCTARISLKADVSLMRKQPSKYVRFGAQQSGTDLRVYDAGNFYISTQGCVNTNVIGELHVKYRVRVKVPVLTPNIVTGNVALHWSTLNCSTASPSNGMALQTGSATGWTIGNAGSGGMIIYAPANVPGNYLVSITINNSLGSTISSPDAISYGSGATVFAPFCYSGSRDQTGLTFSPSASLSTENTIAQFGVNIPATYGGNFTVTGMTIPASSAMDIFIQQLPSALVTAVAPVKAPQTRSFGLTEHQLNKMYSKLLSMGVLTNDDESPVVVTDDDGVIRISQPDHDLPLGTSTSAPPLSKVTSRMRVLAK